MNTRILSAAFCITLLSVAISAIAQDVLPVPPAKAGPAAPPAASTPDPAPPATPAAASSDTTDDMAKTMQDRVDQLEQEVAELKANLLNLQNSLAEKDAELHEIVQALSRRDSNSQPVLALRSIMKNSDEFRKEMQEAVNESIQREGKLIVDNRTSGVQFLSVNGSTQSINALTRMEFTVPVGTLTTELVGQEGSKNWTIGAPGYRQEIIIRPRTRQVVASPVIIVD